MTVDFTYGTDLDNAKKMQGAERFGDFAIQQRTRIMTRPGEPYVIPRKADAPLKKALAKNGARFAFRTVQMTGRDEAEPASARPALKLIKAASPEQSDRAKGPTFGSQLSRESPKRSSRLMRNDYDVIGPEVAGPPERPRSDGDAVHP